MSKSMKCLAIDSTTDTGSIALADENGLLGEYNFAHHMDLSRRIMPNILSLLKDCGLEMKDIQAVGVSLGPGSFTGLRIGVVTAKTIAQVLSIPISGIISLDLLAHQFDYLPDSVVCPLIKVRKGEVYFAFYQVNRGNTERISEYEAATTEEMIEKAKVLNTGIIFAGDGLPANLDLIREGLGDCMVNAPQWLSFPKASIIARLAIEKISRGESDDFLSLAPFYIRRSAPEERLRIACESSPDSIVLTRFGFG